MILLIIALSLEQKKIFYFWIWKDELLLSVSEEPSLEAGHEDLPEFKSSLRMGNQPWRQQMCLGEWTDSSVGQLRNRELRYPGKCDIIPPFNLILRSDRTRQASHVHKLHAKHIKPCFYIFQDCISQQLTLLESWNPKISHVIYSTFSLDT